MAGRGRNRLPEIRRGEGECRAGPDRPDFGSRAFAAPSFRSRSRRSAKAAAASVLPMTICGRPPTSATSRAGRSRSRRRRSHRHYPDTRCASPAMAPRSSGPISLTAPGVAPEEDEIELPPEGTPGGGGAGPAALSGAAGLSAARPLFRALFAASVGHAGPAAGRACRGLDRRSRQFGRRVRSGRGQAGRDAGLSDRLGARSLACRFRAARRDALVRRARGRDQADLRLFLPRHERQSARAYFRTRLRQRAGHRGVHAGRRTAHFGEGRLEGHAGRAGLPARRAGRGLPRIHHRAGAGLQRLSLQSHPRRPDAPRPPAASSASRPRCRARRSRRAPSQRNPYASREPSVTGSLGGRQSPGASPQRKAKKTNSKTSSVSARDRTRSVRLRPIRRQKHPRRAFDHLRDALGRRRRRGLENERQKQRRLAHQHELRCRELAVVDRKIASAATCASR